MEELERLGMYIAEMKTMQSNVSKIVFVKSANDLVEEIDIPETTTSSRKPTVSTDWVELDVHKVHRSRRTKQTRGRFNHS